MTLVADVFPKFRIPKNVVLYMFKNSSLRRPFDKQHGKGDKALLKSELHPLYYIYWSL